MKYTSDLDKLTAEPDPQARYDAVMRLIWDHAPKTLTIAEAGTLAFKIELLLRNPVGFGVSAEGPITDWLPGGKYAPAAEPLGTDCIGELTSK